LLRQYCYNSIDGSQGSVTRLRHEFVKVLHAIRHPDGNAAAISDTASSMALTAAPLREKL